MFDYLEGLGRGRERGHREMPDRDRWHFLDTGDKNVYGVISGSGNQKFWKGSGKARCITLSEVHMLYERQFFHVQSGGNASTWIIGLRGFHETSGDPGASEDSIWLSCDPWNCSHLYIWQKNSPEHLCAGLICVFSVSPITRYLPQRISHIGHYWHCGKHICRNFRSTVFRVVGHCSPVATAAADGGQYQRAASRGCDDMHFHLLHLLHLLLPYRRCCGLQFLDSCHLAGQLLSHPHTLTEKALQGSLVGSG